jgi:hypothetical protein
LSRTAKIIIVGLVALVVAVPVGVVFFFAAGTVSSSQITATPVPIPASSLNQAPAAALRIFLRSTGDHPTTCTRHGSNTVCLLARGAGRCEQDRSGNGSCTYRKGKHKRVLMWMTVTNTDSVTLVRPSG